MSDTKKNVRLNLRLTVETKKQIEEIQNETNTATMTEVIRKAIKLYGTVLSCEKQGRRLVLRTDDGEQELLIL